LEAKEDGSIGVFLWDGEIQRISAGCISLFMLLYAFFTKVFPIVPVLEVKEGREKVPEAMAARVKSYMPETGSSGQVK
jgi:hypothetical protein